MAWERLVRPESSEQLGINHWYDPGKSLGWIRRVGELSSAAVQTTVDDTSGSAQDQYNRQMTAVRNLAGAINNAYVALNLHPQTDPYWVAIGDRRFTGRIFCGLPPGMTQQQINAITLPLPDITDVLQQVGALRSAGGRSYADPGFTAGARQVVGYTRDAPSLSGRSWTADQQWNQERASEGEGSVRPALASPRNMFLALRATAIALVRREVRRIIEDAYDFSGLQRFWIMARSGAPDTAGLAEAFELHQTQMTNAAGAGGFRVAGGVVSSVGAAMMAAGGPIGIVAGALVSAIGLIVSSMRWAVGDCYDQTYWQNNLPLYGIPAIEIGRNQGADPPGPSVQIPVPPPPVGGETSTNILPIELGGRELRVVSGTGGKWYQRREVRLGGVVVGALALGAFTAYLLKPTKKKKARR